MEKISQFFSQSLERINTLWGRLTPLKRALLLGALGLVVAGIIAAGAMQEKDPYEYVFVDLSPDDVQQVTAYFRQNSIADYLVDNKGIKVPRPEVSRLRLKLAQEGLPAHGVVGWEKFDAQDFTRTDFEQRINKQRAIQGE